MHRHIVQSIFLNHANLCPSMGGPMMLSKIYILTIFLCSRQCIFTHDMITLICCITIFCAGLRLWPSIGSAALREDSGNVPHPFHISLSTCLSTNINRLRSFPPPLNTGITYKLPTNIPQTPKPHGVSSNEQFVEHTVDHLLTKENLDHPPSNHNVNPLGTKLLTKILQN